MWKFILCFAFVPLLPAVILPGNVGPFHKISSAPLTVADQPVWEEYGLKEAEQATYQNGGKTLRVQAYRLQDATGALAAFQWQRPANAKPADEKLTELTKLAAVTPNGEIVALGNHVLLLEGYQAPSDELANVFRSLPHQEAGPLPSLPDHMPAGSLVPNSERYITGPASLAHFGPEVSPATAAFHLGTEAEIGVYRATSGDLKLAIFSFPTMDSAKERTELLRKIPNALVKRSGPLVGVVFSPKDANAAEKLLAQVRFQAEITTGQKPAAKKENFGNFMLNLFVLIGILLVFCVLSGLLFGGLRTMFRRGTDSEEGEAMISLHLRDR